MEYHRGRCMQTAFFAKPTEISQSEEKESKELAQLKEKSPWLHKIFSRVELSAEVQKSEARRLVATIDLARAYSIQIQKDHYGNWTILLLSDLVSEHGFRVEDVINFNKKNHGSETHPFYSFIRSKHITPYNLPSYYSYIGESFDSRVLYQAIPLIRKGFIDFYEVSKYREKIGYWGDTWWILIGKGLVKTKEQFIKMDLAETYRLLDLAIYGCKPGEPDVPRNPIEASLKAIETQLRKEGILHHGETVHYEYLYPIYYLKDLIHWEILDIEKAKKYSEQDARIINKLKYFIKNGGLDIGKALKLTLAEQNILEWGSFLANLGYSYQQVLAFSREHFHKLHRFDLLIGQEKITVQDALASPKNISSLQYTDRIPELIVANKISFQAWLELPDDRQRILNWLSPLILDGLVSMDEAKEANEMDARVLYHFSDKFLEVRLERPYWLALLGIKGDQQEKYENCTSFQTLITTLKDVGHAEKFAQLLANSSLWAGVETIKSIKALTDVAEIYFLSWHAVNSDKPASTRAFDELIHVIHLAQKAIPINSYQWYDSVTPPSKALQVLYAAATNLDDLLMSSLESKAHLYLEKLKITKNLAMAYIAYGKEAAGIKLLTDAIKAPEIKEVNVAHEVLDYLTKLSSRDSLASAAAAGLLLQKFQSETPEMELQRLSHTHVLRLFTVDKVREKLPKDIQIKILVYDLLQQSNIKTVVNKIIKEKKEDPFRIKVVDLLRTPHLNPTLMQADESLIRSLIAISPQELELKEDRETFCHFIQARLQQPSPPINAIVEFCIKTLKNKLEIGLQFQLIKSCFKFHGVLNQTNSPVFHAWLKDLWQSKNGTKIEQIVLKLLTGLSLDPHDQQTLFAASETSPEQLRETFEIYATKPPFNEPQIELIKKLINLSVEPALFKTALVDFTSQPVGDVEQPFFCIPR